ncbi:MAG: universal stress protein [Candidatus Nitrosocosmicus sp.]|nr:universal stress protein [Candidatus Nitrosocosmicus sp.]
MIKNIMVTDDGTEVSHRALGFACEIAKPCGASITLLHVIEHIEDPDTMIFRNNQDLIEKAKLMNLGPSSVKNTWQKLAQIKIQKLREQNIKSEYKCLTGDVAEKILEYTLNEEVDLIIMGSGYRLRGISKIKALGSVTRKVSELATCPVLIIH